MSRHENLVENGNQFRINVRSHSDTRLMAGLHSGTHSRAIVIGGILTIAIADAMSDALGIHVSGTG